MVKVGEEMESSSLEDMTIEQMLSEATATQATADGGGGVLNLRDNFFSSLNKHNSIFSLTLDEIQCKSGKNFAGMSMDEFLANICNVEEIQEPQFMAAATNNNNNSRPNLSHQPSFCGKTVDEIWSEIHKEQHRQKFTNVQQNNPWQTQQQALGEITLEDFLVKAGVVQESSSSSSMKQSNGNGNNRSSMVDLGFGIMGDKLGLSMPYHQQNNAARNNNMSGNCFSTYQMLNQSLGVGEPSDNSSIQKCQSLTDWVEHSNKRRIIDGPPEVVVQRRQRRMIKNRESAARSRARKQAYTVELEVELNQLKEENVKLKQSVAESERNRKQEMMQRKQSKKRQKPTERLRTMRRIASMAW